MRPIPLLAEEGAERERDSAKPQRRRRHPSSARSGMCAPKNFVQKTKSCSLVTHRGIAATKKENSPQRRRELFVLVNQRQAVAADCGSSNPRTTRLIPSRKSGA